MAHASLKVEGWGQKEKDELEKKKKIKFAENLAMMVKRNIQELELKTKQLLLAAIVSIFLVGTSGLAEAMPVTAWGTPVESPISSTPVAACDTPGVGSECYNATTHSIGFYIPLNGPPHTNYNGVYGVGTNPSGKKVGTSSDSQSGPFYNPGALTMYLMYTPLVSSLPANLTSAVLTFNFTDLDLKKVNDPNGFFESVQFMAGNGDPLSDKIWVNEQSALAFNYTVVGDKDDQTITFGDVTSFITGDPFYAQLTFGSKMTRYGTWKNTPEYMNTTLVTNANVPEPTSLLLLGVGLAGIWIWGRKSANS